MARNDHPRKLLLKALDAIGISVWLSRGQAGNFEIRAWSDGAEKLYGYKRQEAIGKNYLELFVNPLERAQSATDCERLLTGDRFENFLATDVDANGNARRLLTNCLRVWDDELNEYLQAEVGLDISDVGETSEEMLRRIREVSLKSQDAERRMLLLDNIKQVTAAITSLSADARGLQTVLQAIADSVSALTGADASTSVWGVDTDGTPYHHGRAGRIELGPTIELERRAAAWVSTNPLTRVVDHTTRRNRLPKAIRELSRQWRTAPHALLPMLFAENVVGVIIVVLPAAELGQDRVQWSTELREALEIFAQHAAIAVVTAGQIEHLKRQSEVIAANQERETRDKLTDDFVHRVRHVASPIASSALLLREDIAGLDPATQARLLPKVEVIEARATDFLEQVREIAFGLEVTEFDLSDLLEGVLRDLRTAHGSLEADYRDATTRPPLVTGIRPFIFSALENVLVNAVTAMDGEGHLSVEVSDNSDRSIYVRVSDSGPGIPVDVLDRVWSKDYTTKGEGHGYGLWRTRDVIESIRGSIQVATTSSDGTTFEIELPRG